MNMVENITNIDIGEERPYCVLCMKILAAAA
jgi:hypothetical protein